MHLFMLFPEELIPQLPSASILSVAIKDMVPPSPIY